MNHLYILDINLVRFRDWKACPICHIQLKLWKGFHTILLVTVNNVSAFDKSSFQKNKLSLTDTISLDSQVER